MANRKNDNSNASATNGEVSDEMTSEEVLAEGASALPERALMRHRRRRPLASASAAADHGSVANANSTSQTINNPQVAVGNNGPVTQVGNNTNTNTTNQSGTVLNI